MPDRRRVVVTGLGAVSPLGVGARAMWRAMLEGQSGVRRVESFDASDFPVRIAGEVRDFDPLSWLPRKEVRRLDRFVHFAVAAAAEALEDAGVELVQSDGWRKRPGNLDPERTGVIVGSGIGGILEIEEQYRRFAERGPGRIGPFLIPKMMGNAASGNIGIAFGLRGPSFGTVSACASGAHALMVALMLVRSGAVDAVLAGGAEAALSFLGLGGFSAMGALSRRNDEPERASRPFDRERDGFVMSEGAGVALLEELEHARRRKARIYAELLGVGASGDAFHITEPDRDGRGAAAAMRAALEDARLRPEDVDYINAHGTSTPYNDRVETAATKALFGEHAYKLAMSSSKSMLGHLLGASGGVEFAATVLAVHEGVIPPTINYENPDPDCDLDYVPNEAREGPVRAALTNSLGFGGHNASIAVGRLRED